jgi:hypothetical protein
MIPEEFSIVHEEFSIVLLAGIIVPRWSGFVIPSLFLL